MSNMSSHTESPLGECAVGDVVWAGHEVGQIKDVLKSDTTGGMIIVIEFVRNVGNNRPDHIEIMSETTRNMINASGWRKATVEEVEEAVAVRRKKLNDRLDQIVELAKGERRPCCHNG